MYESRFAGRLTLLLMLAAGISGCAGSSELSAQPELPEGMVAAAHPLAAEAGAAVLRDGGNAVDAAVATAFTLNVVEPHASGIGGGGFMLLYLADSQEVHVMDYREEAPSALTESLYVTDGKWQAREMQAGGKSVAVPGMVRGVLRMHDRFGKLPRERLLQPAITHASEGFSVSSDLAGHIENNLDLLMEDELGAATFLQDGIFPLTEGTNLKQPQLASTMTRIAAEGEAAIYNPDTAENIAAEVRRRGGVMKAEDILSYEPEEREPVRADYRGYEIVTIGAPSSGGLTVLQTLSILDHFDLSGYEADSPEYLALLVKAFEQAQLSTDEFVADPAFTEVPTDKLLDESWAEEKARAISAALSIEDTLAPAGAAHSALMVPTVKEHPGNTTHFSVVDRDGNMVALTQTIDYFFGSKVIVPQYGIILNNEMADFSYETGSVNVPAPGKRPRSSISPVLVMKDGKPIAAIGSPGGRRIPAALVQIIVRCIDFDESLQDAIDAPRLYTDSQRERVSYEPRFTQETINQLSQILEREKVWEFEPKKELDNYFGGAQGIWIRSTPQGPKLEGGADPRRNGAVASTSTMLTK
jgi:gamma-glutamyltranspeptidase/glutathione hydrolase